MPEHRTTRHRLIAAGLLLIAVGVCAWSWWTGGLLIDLLDTSRPAAEKLAAMRESFQSWGAAAPLIYFLFVVIEVVVAPIPGTMLYAPGGVIFGGLLGGTITLLGNTVGAGLACLIVRWLGGDRLSHWYDDGKLRRIGNLIDERGLWIVLLLRLNPLTSSDLVSYAAGFTKIPIWQVMLGTFLGMAPLCFAQAWFAERLLTHFPSLLYPGLILCAIYAILVITVIVRLKPAPRTDP